MNPSQPASPIVQEKPTPTPSGGGVWGSDAIAFVPSMLDT